MIDVKRSDAKSGRSSFRNANPFVKSTTTTSGGGTTNDEEESFVDRVEFVELDQFDQWRSIVVQQQQQQQQSWDALILDIGSMIGNDLHLTALSLANELLKLMALLSTQNKNDESGVVNMPRIVLIKSKSLSSLARRLVHNQRLIDGTQRLPHHLKRSHHPYIIASVGVEQYRRTIPHVVRAGDALLEVGCHYGRTTFRLHSAAAVDKDGFCIGVDIGPKVRA